ncbi:MAG TPA: RNA 2',3'-cyclic phosphodiesterase [Burkholderiales bacterium]|nr:RNA 2',3'-cyclic phosphodiesterase [Burkholderiales bacterium]
MPDAAGQRTARMFFALWPDTQVRGLLLRQGLKMHRLLGGKLTREESVHLTLVFLGDVALERVPELQQRAAGVRFEPFVLRVEQAGCWRHNSIGWVGPNQTPAALVRLVADLEGALEGEGLRFDHRPYAAHITLLRKARCAPMDGNMPVIEWAVRDFVLVRSERVNEGSRYTIVERWRAGEGV